MNGNFGKFIEQKRKAMGMSLRGLAAELGIAPAFMSDIEKGHRYPPAKEKLYEMARILKLNEDETNRMFDLAAGERTIPFHRIFRNTSWATTMSVLRFGWPGIKALQMLRGRKSSSCWSRKEIRKATNDSLQLLAESTGTKS